jgi:DNA-binding transcriptional regulator YdaS (Cro superfamily)
MSKSLMTPEEQQISVLGVQKAIRLAGGLRAMARMLGISHGTVSHWSGGVKPIPLWRAMELERCLVGEITISELRPDLLRCGITAIHKNI